MSIYKCTINDLGHGRNVQTFKETCNTESRVVAIWNRMTQMPTDIRKELAIHGEGLTSFELSFKNGDRYFWTMRVTLEEAVKLLKEFGNPEICFSSIPTYSDINTFIASQSLSNINRLFLVKVGLKDKHIDQLNISTIGEVYIQDNLFTSEGVKRIFDKLRSSENTKLLSISFEGQVQQLLECLSHTGPLEKLVLKTKQRWNLAFLQRTVLSLKSLEIEGPSQFAPSETVLQKILENQTSLKEISAYGKEYSLENSAPCI